MRLVVTEDKKFLRIVEAGELELEQINYSLKKRIYFNKFSDDDIENLYLKSLMTKG